VPAESFASDFDAPLHGSGGTSGFGESFSVEAEAAPALKAAPDDPEVLLLQANILQKLGQGEEAKVVFERAKVLHKAALEARGGGVPAEDAAGIAPALPGAAEYQELQQYGIPR
jgi:hypothetical protein